MLNACMYDGFSPRSCSRDPIGYEGSEWNLFEYGESSPVVYVDPDGNVSISCKCAGIPEGKRGTRRDYFKAVDCQVLASTCCDDACDGRWTGSWKLVPGRDAYDDAEDEYCWYVTEIVVSFVPIPYVGPCVKSSVGFVKKQIARRVCRKYSQSPRPRKPYNPEMDPEHVFGPEKGRPRGGLEPGDPGDTGPWFPEYDPDHIFTVPENLDIFPWPSGGGSSTGSF